MNLILHDYFESLEGGGRLCSLLAQGLPANLGYGFAKANHPFLTPLSPDAQHNFQAYSAIPLWRQFKLARTFSRKTTFLSQYETVIYSGFYTPLAVHHHQLGKNICYCHTPPRFIYDQRDFYQQQLPLGLRPALQAFIHYLQPRYEQAISQMDLLIANSHHVRQRIQHYLGKDAVVIYPPCDTQRFTWQGQADYYLSTGRLDPLKRVDLIIQAFLKMPDKKLIVTSGGSELRRLQQLAQAAPHIRFTNWVSETQLAQLVGGAIAILYLPKNEDFGLSPVEAMAAGKPVIGVAEGGLLETMVPEQTGILIESPPTIAAICEAVTTLTPTRALSMRSTCQARAQHFGLEIFLDNMRRQLTGSIIAKTPI
jgi:glycosyltransferase involved in cell wall biosynthesis